MKAKEFENLCLARMRIEEERGRATMSRYGVQGSFIGEKVIDLTKYAEMLRPRQDVMGVLRRLCDEARKTGGGWQPRQSYPDFEGIVAARGQQFIFDCKVCGEASLSLHTSHASDLQIAHLMKRSNYGAICFFAIHFTARELQTKKEPAETWAFPVAPYHPFWVQFQRQESKRISRTDCRDHGVEIQWNTAASGRTERPDILSAVLVMAEQGHCSFERWEPRHAAPAVAAPY